LLFRDRDVGKVTDAIDVNATYLSRLGLSYGDLKELLRTTDYELTHAQRYEVWGSDTSFVAYRFLGHIDDDWDWFTEDSDRCFTIIAPLGEILPSVKTATTVDELALSLGLSYQIRWGGGTAYFIAERFMEVELLEPAESGERIFLQIALEENENAITPNTQVWLFAPEIEEAGHDEISD
jgi:hypothetical protein